MKKPTSTEEAIRIIETFDTLPAEQRVEIFRNLSAQAREELIQVTSRPGEITRLISDEEMFFTIKELGEENALALVGATTGRQLQYLLDIDFWKKEKFDPEMAGRWLDLIARIGENKILQFLQVTDPELLVTALRPVITVEIRNPDTDLTEQRDSLPPFTLDDLFFLDFPDARWEEALKLIVEVIFNWKQEYYFELMENLARGVAFENEELALKWSRGRLADHGIPDFDEAVEVYSYLGPAEISQEGEEPFAALDYGLSGAPPVLEYPLKLVEQENFFRKCLDQISDGQQRDRIALQLAHLANKVIVADGRDPGSLSQMNQSLNKISGHISIALEDLCGTDLAKGEQILACNHLEILFRRGFSLIHEVIREAGRLLATCEGGIDNLGMPLAGLLKALLNRRPCFGGLPPSDPQPREFNSLQDLEAIRAVMKSEADGERWEPL